MKQNDQIDIAIQAELQWHEHDHGDYVPRYTPWEWDESPHAESPDTRFSEVEGGEL